jgi:hypothetical protein
VLFDSLAFLSRQITQISQCATVHLRNAIFFLRLVYLEKTDYRAVILSMESSEAKCKDIKYMYSLAGKVSEDVCFSYLIIGSYQLEAHSYYHGWS